MNKRTKTVVLIVVIIAVIGIVVGVAFIALKKSPDMVAPGISSSSSSSEEGEASGSEEGKTYEPGYYPDGENKSEDPGVAMTINGVDIDFDNYRYYFMVSKNYTEYYNGADYFLTDEDNAKLEQLKTETEEQLKRVIYFNNMGKDLGVSLSDEEKEAAVEYSEEEFVSQGMNIYFTDYEFYKRAAVEDALTTKCINALLEEGLAAKYDESKLKYDETADTLVSAEHILVRIPDGEEVTDEGIENVKKQAQDLYDRIISSDDPYAKFTELKAEFNADTGQPETGYTFGPGEMMEDFYLGAEALEIGGISEPVFINDWYTGCHIIYRREISDDYVKSAVDQISLPTVQQEIMDLMDGVIDAYSVNYGEYYDGISINTIH